IHQQVRARHRLDDKQRHGGGQGEKTRQHIEPRGQLIARQRSEQARRGGRYQKDAGECVDRPRFSPRKRSMACISTVSKRSRMRNRKMPMTMKAISTEKATLISTTSGMPLAPVAASTRPFSSDMNPIT